MSPETGEAQASKNLNARYAEFDFQSRKRYVGIAVLLALVCVPSGSIIDYFIYPERFLDFFVIRLIVDLLLVLLWFIFKNSRSDEFLKIRVLCVGMMQSIIVAFCVMIHLADGVNSPYYAGMMLVMYGVAVLIPWSSAETIFISVASIVLYAIAVLSEGESLTPNSVPILVNNLFFLTLTAAISVAASRALAANRLRDFQLQMQLADQNQKLQEVDRLKTDFFANISHELRTPLTLIASPVDEILARHQGLPEQVTNNLMIVQRNTLRLLKLINDLLDLTRLEQQPGSLFRRDRELSRFTVGIVNSVRHLAASKQQRLTVESCNEALPVAIDAGRFEKVVLNLLTNAIKYTQRGGTITVSMRSRDGRALLVVEDNGPGIPENLLERIFDRFFQVDSKRGAGAGQGVGIGLALAREIAEAHSGTLKAFSELRRGTRFEVELPLQSKGELELNDQSEDFVEPFRDTFSAADRVFLREIEQHVKLPDVGAGDATVLVADDESDMREFIVTLLAEKYHVIQTQHGGNVLELVEQHRPHVIVLDWMMPQLKGLDVCRAIKSHDRHSDCKVVMLTARADERSKIEALSAGADDFLTKPFGGTELHCRVQNLAAAASFQREINRANTELKESLDRLQETEQRLIQSEKVNAIESLSAGLLHEINNPLNYAIMAINWLRKHSSQWDREMNESLDDAHDGMSRINEIVSSLRSFAHPERPGAQSEFRVADIIGDALKLCAGRLQNVSVSTMVDPELMLEGQRTQITHVLINLLNNSSKALERVNAPGEILIKASSSSNGFKITVSDNGPGIPAEVKRRMFEPFFTTGEVGASMGLGLSICNTIVSQHGGSIAVESEIGKGTIISIFLPTRALASSL